MRAFIPAALLTLLLFSCNNSKMQQLEKASSTVTKCLNNCSLSTPSVSDGKEAKKACKEQAVSEEKTQGGEGHLPNVLINHFSLW